MRHHFEEARGRRWLVVTHDDGVRHYRNPVNSEEHADRCLPILARMLMRLDKPRIDVRVEHVISVALS